MFLRAEKNKFHLKYLHKPFLNPKLQPISLYSEDFFLSPTSSNLSFFNYYNNDILYDTLENNYENSKHFKSLYFNNYQNIFINTLNSNLPITYTSVMDSFRADFDENS
jgi:hypothetical protein